MSRPHQAVIDRLDFWIVQRSGRVILVFLVLTGVFALGLGNISTEAGTEQFAEDVPAEEALNTVNQEFEPHFAGDTGRTQLIQTGDNVLAKKEILRMLRAQDRLENRPGLRVASTASTASIVAQTLDPSATTTTDQIDAVEQATEGQIDRAVRRAADENPVFIGLLSEDFNAESASASATIGLVEHDLPVELSSGAGQGGSSPLTPIQLEAKAVVESVGGDIRVFGSGIISEEFGNVIGDSLLIVVPAAVLFIVLFLIIAYRDLVDLLLGVIALGMAIVWTFGFMGLVGIPFSQMLIAVPPLLLAVGIDFGIHAVNRYREERMRGQTVDESMRVTTDQLLVAFFIVTTTTVLGFLSNLVSQLIPIRDFGFVASVGIVFVFLIFGVFLPALKVQVDRWRERYPIPTFSQRPIGSEGSVLGRVLTGGVYVARVAPVLFILTILLSSAAAGYYARDVDTSFSNEDFLPPEENPPYLMALPEPFKPSVYTVTRDIHFLEENFASSEEDTITVYVEGPLERDFVLESIYRAGENPPETFLSSNRRADATSVISIIQSQAASDPAFAAVVRRNDRNRNGVPDRNLEEVYDALFASDAGPRAAQYLTEDHRSTRIVYSVEADASQDVITRDAREVASRYRLTATATGNTVVFQAISDLILASALQSLVLALIGTVLFLILIYWLIEGRPSLGVANTIPILVTVAALLGTMRYFEISFNALTATILAITIGLGIDYSVHVVHRFADEYHERGEIEPALRRTVHGTGGALAGSMLTTVFGIGVLVLSIFPAIGQFGILTALSVLYSFLASLFVLPPVLAIWARLVG